MQLILLPGMDGTGRLFADFIDAMELRVAPKVIAYPGDRALSYGELTDLVRRALPIDEPYVLLAESFSGPIAIALAAEELPGLAALILVSSFARAPIRLPRILRAIVAWMPMRWAPVALVSRVILGRSATPIAQSTLCEALASVSASA